jgi:hypothetical protein
MRGARQLRRLRGDGVDAVTVPLLSEEELAALAAEGVALRKELERRVRLQRLITLGVISCFASGCALYPRPSPACVSPCGVTLTGAEEHCATFRAHEADFLRAFAAHTPTAGWSPCAHLRGYAVTVSADAQDDAGRPFFATEGLPGFRTWGHTDCSTRRIRIAGPADIRDTGILAHELLHVLDRAPGWAEGCWPLRGLEHWGWAEAGFAAVEASVRRSP